MWLFKRGKIEVSFDSKPHDTFQQICFGFVSYIFEFSSFQTDLPLNTSRIQICK